jgi:hypothetical protein
MAPSVDSATRKKVLRVVFISLLLDLVSTEGMGCIYGILTHVLRSASVCFLPAMSFTIQCLTYDSIHPTTFPDSTSILQRVRFSSISKRRYTDIL